MKKMQYFFLMLKQGMKGVFRFRAQFIIILVLTFLATLILSVSLSTGRRIQSSYDNVVGQVDPFSYETKIQMGTQGSGAASVDVTPIKSAINTDFSVVYEDKTDFDKAQTFYNYVLSHPEFYEQQQDVLKVSDKSNHNNFINQVYKTPAFEQAFIKDVDKTDFEGEQLRETQLRMLLLDSLLKQLDTLSDQKMAATDNFKYSAVGQYTVKNPYWYQKYVEKDANDHYVLVSWINNLNLRQENLDGDHFAFFHYLLRITDSVIFFFNTVKENLAPYVTNLNNAQLYALIFGDMPSTNPEGIDPNWIVSAENSYSVYLLKDEPKKNYQFLNKDGDIANVNEINEWQLVAKNGLKGVTSPFMDLEVKNETSWDNVQTMDQVVKAFNVNLKSFPNFLDKSSVFNNPYVYLYEQGLEQAKPYLDYDELYGIWIISNKLAAAAFDYNFSIRREAAYFDSTTNLSYRGIIVDENENYNFSVLKGRGINLDEDSGEIVVSEQFAHKYHIKIGSWVHAGNGSFLVVGFGTDAFSFIPSQDTLNPIPNPSSSSFIYGTKAVINRIFQESNASRSSYDAGTETMNFLYWDKGDKKTSLDRKGAYLAALMPTQDNLNFNLELLKGVADNQKTREVPVEKVTGKINHLNPKTASLKLRDLVSPGIYNLTSFNSSNDRYSWTVPPLVIKTFLTVTGVASAVIIIIVLGSLVICVKKTVQFNAKQIGILKAMGATPSQISISYISYSIVIMLVSIPVGWLLGNILQLMFAKMFETYFSIVPDILFFDWISFVIMFVGLGILAGVIGYVSAYILTNKSVMKILENPIKWHNSKLFSWLILKPFKNSKFKVRFSLTLSNAGSRQIWLMAIVIFVTSVLVTMSLVIPSVAVTSNRLFYRSIRYANEYQNTELVTNAPLSKGTISYWEGHDVLESKDNYVPPSEAKLRLDSSKNNYGYYKNLESYFSTISNAKVLPDYIYQPATDGQEESFINTFLKTAETSDSRILSLMTDIFGNNFYQNIGVGFSIGMIDAVYGVMMHSLEDLNVDIDDKTYWTDEEKISYAQDFSAWLTSAIPQIIKAIANGIDGGSANDHEGEGNETWKEEVMQSLYKNLPSYVKGYVGRSDSRLDQYAITYQNEIYIPEKETLTTIVDGVADGYGQSGIALTGLDQNQTSISINKTDKDKVYLPQSILEKVYQIMDQGSYNQNITYKNLKIYDVTTNTLTLPILPNRQAQSYYHFNKKSSRIMENFKANVRKLVMLDKNNEYIPIPENAWIYDDTNYVNMQKADPKFSLDQNRYEVYQNKYYLNPYEMDNNKFSYKVEYQLDDQGNDTNKLADEAYLFKEFIMNQSKDRVTGVYARPYYQYKDIKLMIPIDYIADVNKILYPGANHAKVPNQTWYEELQASQVPDSVKKGWKKPDSSYLVINPYDLRYTDPEIEKKVQSKDRSPITNLTEGPEFWYRYANEGAKPPLNFQDLVYQYDNNPDLKINFEAVGSIASFDGHLVVIDSNLANKLIGVPTTRHYQSNYKILGDKVYSAGQKDSNGYVSRFDRYNVRQEKFSEPNINSSALWQPIGTTYQNGLKAEDYAPMRWHNSKLSNEPEALPFTTSVSYIGYGGIGLYAIHRGAWNGLTVSQWITSSTLLSEKRALINQITGLAIAIGSLILVAVIITASLLVMLVGDIYIQQYRQFMVLMKALGYSNAGIMGYSLGTVSAVTAIMLCVGHAVGWIIISIFITILDRNGMAIPFGFNWWVIPAFILIIAFSYVVSLYVSSGQARRDPPTKVLAQANE